MLQPLSTWGSHTLVRRFAARTVQGVHRDDHSRISIMLRGAVAEDSAWGGARLDAGDVLFKSREIPHEDRFGPQGASILSVLFDGGEECPFAAARLSGAWLVIKAEKARHHVFAVSESVAARDEHAFQAATIDLLTIGATNAALGRAPRWLQCIYDDLCEFSLAAIDVGERARAAGRHPVTLSRDFRRHYGLSLTEHAMRQAVRRALVALAHGAADLADVALEAGFYDQSHMNRVFNRLTGRTPGAQRALLARAG